uniref:Uncharacterized protein n=1 Tax=Romanomermis culicivorax TaxID=13658 RepID=A0A915K8H7_ROMCU
MVALAIEHQMPTTILQGNTYAYRAYLERKLNYSRNAKSIQVTATGYTFENDDVLDIKKNKGALQTVQMFKNSIMTPHAVRKIVSQKFLLTQIDLRASLTNLGGHAGVHAQLRNS